MRTLILAGSYSEAAKYARGKGLKSYRFAVNANAVQSYPAQAVVELPGYESRRDKFALEAVVKRLARRGVERTKDSYTPPPPPPAPEYGEADYQADLLLGDVPVQVDVLIDVLEKHNADTLRELGASDEEIATVTGIQETAERIEELQAKPARKPGDPAPKRRVNASKKAGSVVNNQSGPGKTSVPEATNSSVDDLFED